MAWRVQRQSWLVSSCVCRASGIALPPSADPPKVPNSKLFFAHSELEAVASSLSRLSICSPMLASYYGQSKFALCILIRCRDQPIKLLYLRQDLRHVECSCSRAAKLKISGKPWLLSNACCMDLWTEKQQRNFKS